MILKTNNKKGVSLVEIIIASSIISLTLLVLVSVYSSVARYSLANVKALKATQLVEEAVEVLKYLSNSGYSSNISTLSDNTEYYLFWDPSVNSGSWTATTSNILLEDKYEVNFTLSPVYRDGSFNVVSSGGSLDTDSKKATITISWDDGSVTNTKSTESYIFNIFDN